MREYINQFLIRDQRPLLIRDPVHNYIELTAIEQDLIDTQLFQRLRFITQNSTVFYTYPANRSSRFEHSIGAAHLAGRFIAAALGAHRGPIIGEFLEHFDAAVLDLCRNTGIDSAPYVGDARQYTQGAIVWQAARLVVLLHDIGHLPFSHLAEHAIAPHYSLILGGHPAEPLWQEEKERVAYHEFMALCVVTESRDLAAVFDDRPDQPRRLFLELVKATFERTVPILGTIHGLMSGEIDADRGDYIARDGRNSGVEFGNYDISRLADFMRLHGRHGTYSLLPLELALSSIETFLSARYQLYKWVLFHHHVAATDTALQHAIDIALQRIADGDAALAAVLDVRRFLPDGLLREGIYSDDVWMWGVLREIYRLLGTRADPTAEDRFFRRLLDCCLHRGELVSLWKTPVEFRDFSAVEFEPAFRRAINDKYKRLHKEGVIEVNHPEQGLWKYYQNQIALNLVAEYCIQYDYLRTRSLEQAINKDYKDFRILLEPKQFAPAKSTDAARLLTKDGQAPRITEYSATVRGLPAAWDGDIHLFAFAVAVDDERPDRPKARERLIDGFVEWYGRRDDLKFPGPAKEVSDE